MNLNDLLKDINCSEITGNAGMEISGISINSRKIRKGDIFVAIKGFKYDGHDFVFEALANGAAAIMVQKKLELPLSASAIQIVVNDCRIALPLLCRNFYKNPSKSLRLVGITGTNGKTTSVFLINSIFKSAGYNTSYITTVGAAIKDEAMIFERTTPESIDLNRFFCESRHGGVNAASMELSSHSIDLHRVDYLDFDCFVFTNLTQDHLDYHIDMENYFEVKKRLFLAENRKIYGGIYAVINADDFYGMKLAELTDLKVLTYAVKKSNADIFASSVRNSINGIELNIEIKNKEKFTLKSNLCGYFNVYNILASVGACLSMDIKIHDIQKGIELMSGVKGRFEKINLSKKENVIVDYAHTPDGLENVLLTAKSLLPAGGKLISVFGCGGDRDKKKRKIMGAISAKIADFSIITSDNPRTEDPLAIIKMIKDGFAETGSNSYVVEIDRKEAILEALEMAAENDIVIVAGKGHEDYQEFANYRIHFSDQEIIKEWGLK
ncbi:MAG: UDP-N-acetylmuramoyl-L-alanyl-D-glutamate--2,6-diaminopimelate ligase [Actinobacteria bacterium]|nr:UDP-N-acetylmuramoyl-L-alanyl-D-glutamate--2,6-diaminopimelate ligase [Actinomycetota bacterium]